MRHCVTNPGAVWICSSQAWRHPCVIPCVTVSQGCRAAYVSGDDDASRDARSLAANPHESRKMTHVTHVTHDLPIGVVAARSHAPAHRCAYPQCDTHPTCERAPEPHRRPTATTKAD